MRSAGWLDGGLTGRASYEWNKQFGALGPRDWNWPRGQRMAGQNNFTGDTPNTAYAMPTGSGRPVVSWEISKRRTINGVISGPNENTYKYLVPGDIYFYFGISANNNWIGNHITMISSVTPNADGSVSAGNVGIIESTFAGDGANMSSGKVRKEKSLLNYIGTLAEPDALHLNWILVRLKP